MRKPRPSIVEPRDPGLKTDVCTPSTIKTRTFSAAELLLEATGEMVLMMASNPRLSAVIPPVYGTDNVAGRNVDGFVFTTSSKL